MIFREERKDLFSVNFKEWTPVHCISRDCKMGAGIAVPMRKKFELGGLKKVVNIYPTSVYHNGVFNLITKAHYWNKPTLNSLKKSLIDMKSQIEELGIKKIVMPKIGCGLDKLNWPEVRELIKVIFEEMDIEILVCYI